MTGLFDVVLPIMAFIVVLGVLVLAHEFGHFSVAKRVGIKVEEFALGMGPRLWSRQVGETVYSLRALPLGGFCRMAGEDAAGGALSGDDVPTPSVQKERQFFAKSPLQRAAVLFAGPLMNLLLAGVVYSIIFGAFGLPTKWVNGAVIGDVSPGTPAAEAGILPHDRITAIDGTPVRTWEEMASRIEASPDRPLTLTIERRGAGNTLEVKVTPQRLTRSGSTRGSGFLGIVRQSTKVQRVGWGEALKLGFVQTWHVLVAMLVGFWQLITGKMQGPVTGPVGIARMTGQAARYGWNSLLELMAFLSINLGIINLLPFPALDGGRLAFLAIEGVRGKPVDPEREGFVHFIGFALLMLFLAVVTFRDLEHLFWPFGLGGQR